MINIRQAVAITAAALISVGSLMPAGASAASAKSDKKKAGCAKRAGEVYPGDAQVRAWVKNGVLYGCVARNVSPRKFGSARVAKLGPWPAGSVLLGYNPWHNAIAWTQPDGSAERVWASTPEGGVILAGIKAKPLASADAADQGADGLVETASVIHEGLLFWNTADGAAYVAQLDVAFDPSAASVSGKFRASTRFESAPVTRSTVTYLGKWSAGLAAVSSVTLSSGGDECGGGGMALLSVTPTIPETLSIEIPFERGTNYSCR